MNITNETVVFAGDSAKATTDDVLGRWWWLAPMLLVFLLCCVMACLVRGKGPLRPAAHSRKRSTARDVDYTPLAHAPPSDDLLGDVVSLEEATQPSLSRNWQDDAEPRGVSINGPEPNWLDFSKRSLPPPEPMAPIHAVARSRQQSEVPNLFDAIDTNHDGVISRAEFAEASRRAFDLHAAPGGHSAPPKAAPLGPLPPLNTWPGQLGGAWTGHPTSPGAPLVGPQTSSHTGLFPTEPMATPFGAVGNESLTGRGPSPGPSRQASTSPRSFTGFAYGQPPTARQASDSMRGFPALTHGQAPAPPQAKHAMMAPPRMPSMRPQAAAAAHAPPVPVAVAAAPGSGPPSFVPPTLAVPSFAPPLTAVSPTAAAHLVPSEPVAVSAPGMLR